MRSQNFTYAMETRKKATVTATKMRSRISISPVIRESNSVHTGVGSRNRTVAPNPRTSQHWTGPSSRTLPRAEFEERAVVILRTPIATYASGSAAAFSLADFQRSNLMLHRYRAALARQRDEHANEESNPQYTRCQHRQHRRTRSQCSAEAYSPLTTLDCLRRNFCIRST